MSVGILLLTHPGTGRALIEVATRLLRQLPLKAEAFELAFDADLDAALPLASAAMRKVDGGEILMEFIGDGATAAPRLAQCRPDRDQVRALWAQAVETLIRFGRLGLVHGDLSPFNLLVAGFDPPGEAEPELVVIDVPQVVDLVANPNGVEFLHRDCRNLADWFVRRGLDVDGDALLAEVLGAAW